MMLIYNNGKIDIDINQEDNVLNRLNDRILLSLYGSTEDGINEEDVIEKEDIDNLIQEMKIQNGSLQDITRLYKDKLSNIEEVVDVICQFKDKDKLETTIYIEYEDKQDKIII